MSSLSSTVMSIAEWNISICTICEVNAELPGLELVKYTKLKS